MKIDYQFLKEDFFPIFLEADSAQIFFKTQLHDPIINTSSQSIEKFAFHWYLMCDEDMVTVTWPRENKGPQSPHDVLMQTSSGAESYKYIPTNQPVRLTFNGQEFGQNLIEAKQSWLHKIGHYGIGVASEAIKSGAVQLIVDSIKD